MQICRALLESKQWDLEATAREHLNIPSNEPSVSPPRPSAPIPDEAPNARQVLRPQPRDNPASRPIVARGSNSVFTWAAYLITLPFRMTYNTVFGVFDFVLSIFGFQQDSSRTHRQRRLLGKNRHKVEKQDTLSP